MAILLRLSDFYPALSSPFGLVAEVLHISALLAFQEVSLLFPFFRLVLWSVSPQRLAYLIYTSLGRIPKTFLFIFPPTNVDNFVSFVVIFGRGSIVSVNYRELGKTGWKVSEISFGAWAVGGSWGDVEDSESLRAMHRAVDLGVNFFDTADVYGDGRSERLIRQLRSERSETIYVATKAGRRLDPHETEGYNAKNLSAFVERSLVNLGVEALDLLQLHCPPTDVYYVPEVFEALEGLVQQGKLKGYGASVARVEEGLKAMEYPNLQSIQIIFNIFRQRPSSLFLKEAERRQVGVLARLPLSSGMLTGKLKADSSFQAEDHRSFNREGAAFDKGETFSGLPYDVGVEAVEEIRPLVPPGMTMGQFALKWILMHNGVTCAIPGAKTVVQADQNFAVSDFEALPSETMDKLESLYRTKIAKYVHQRW